MGVGFGLRRGAVCLEGTVPAAFIPNVALCKEVSPRDEQCLQRQPEPQSYGRDVWKKLRVERHVDVSGKHREEQRDQAPGRVARVLRDEQQ